MQKIIAFCELVKSSWIDWVKVRPGLNRSTREVKEYICEKVEYGPFFVVPSVLLVNGINWYL